MLTFPLPAAVDGGALESELAAAGVPGHVYVRGDSLVVSGVSDDDRDAVALVVQRHVPVPPTDPHVDFRKAVEASTNLAQLKAALVGNAGPGAAARAAR